MGKKREILDQLRQCHEGFAEMTFLISKIANRVDELVKIQSDYSQFIRGYIADHSTPAPEPQELRNGQPPSLRD